jgi:hypothetical protein
MRGSTLSFQESNDRPRERPASAGRATLLIPVVLAIAGLGATGALAQVQIDKRRPAARSGEVRVESSFGSVKVIGWEKDEVAVTGVLAAGAEGIEFDGDEEGVYVQVVEPEDWSYGGGDDTEYRSEIVVSVPLKSSVGVQTINASIEIEGISGTAGVETTNGTVKVTGRPTAVAVDSITGSVTIFADAAEMRVESVSAPVTLRGAARAVEVGSVTGMIDVEGLDLERVELGTTSGDVRLAGSFRGEEGVRIQTHAGNVTLEVPPDIAARFQIQTFSGTMESALGPKPRRSERYSPFQELRFATAETEFEIEVTTFSGNVTIRRAGGSPARQD